MSYGQIKPLFNTPINWGHPLAQGLVASYLFNEGCGDLVHDSCGINDGKMINMAPLSPTSGWVSGPHGGALAFDGGNDYLIVPYNSIFDFGAADFSICFGFTPKDTVQRGSIFASGSVVTAFSFWIDYHYQGTRNINIWASSNGTSWNLINADPGGNGIGALSLTLNSLNDIVVTRNGNNWKSYINTVKDKDLTVAGTIFPVNSIREIGRQGSYGYLLRGDLSYFNIFNRVLSAEEIAYLYAFPWCMYDQKPKVFYSLPNKTKSRRFRESFPIYTEKEFL